MAEPILWAVVLAAGQARRMGGRPKPLCPVEGEPMVRRVVRRALEAVDGGVVVVVGAHAPAVAKGVQGLGPRVVTVVNPRFAEGMSTSLKAGIHALPPVAGGALILLADQPGVSAGLLRRLKMAWQGGVAAACRYPDGSAGPPCILGKELWPQVEGLSGDEGARRILAHLASRLVLVEADASQLADVDTPEDLEDWRASHRHDAEEP